MRGSGALRLVGTIRDRCRRCFQCVRECPAKAVRILDGQADVIPERCIGCGNCVRVCNQRAKVAVGVSTEVRELLATASRVAAIVAPSFPAEFPEIDDRALVGMLRRLGFAVVSEVGFGADLVARAYRRLSEQDDGGRYIATSCPAIVGYVEKYYPELVPSLAPIVSPMVAAARALHAIHGDQLRIVFIGPCLAKRREAASENLTGEVDLAMTFADLREMLAAAMVTPGAVTPSAFDPPRARRGAIFPVRNGLLEAAGIREDLVVNQVASEAGGPAFMAAIREAAGNGIPVRLLEVLCCNGCVMGAGMTTGKPLLSRRASVSDYVRRRLHEEDAAEWEAQMRRFASLDLSRSYTPQDQRLTVPSREELAQILLRMGKAQPEEELDCGACGYESCIEHAIAIYRGLAESDMCLPHTVEQLHRTVSELHVSHQELASAQEALMQSEKLASMGQLAAGIAHEINNPLGIVLMYAHLMLESAGEGGQRRDDLRVIADEADRCRKIVSGLLNFARQNRVVRAPVDLSELAERTLRAMPVPAGVEVAIECRTADPVAELDRDQMVQVLTNLVTNACTAMTEGGRLTVAVGGDAGTVALEVSDSGIGIPKENLEKIFHPFFTTKQIGKGTGLGLAVTYGIVKMHRGNVTCVSNADPRQGPTGTTFTVVLPRHGETAE